MQFDDFILEQAQGPFGVPLRGWPACQRDQFCFRHAVENPWPGRVRVIFAGQHGFEAFLDQLPPSAKDVGDAGIQRLSDPAVAPTLALLRHIGLQQDAGFRQQLGGTLAFADKIVELRAFIRTQTHNVFLDGNLFRGHESPPGLTATEIQKTASVVALTYRVTVDVPARFKNSKAVGAVFGLTPTKYQSGESDRTGRISRCGDEMMRMMLYEAAQVMLVVSTKWSWLKAWAMKIAKSRGMKKAIVALARRLAVIMHRIWVDGTEFRWTKEVAAA